MEKENFITDEMTMEKARVPKGERYWYITELGYVASDKEINIRVNNIDGLRAERGNYFYTEEEAESVVKKFRAVIKGADVIETPDTDYVENEIHKIVNEITQGYDRVYVADGEGNIHGNTTYEELTDYLRLIADLFRTKIVK